MITVTVEGRLVRWYDDVGALFDEGEVVADIQTADGIARVIAPYSGRLTEMQVLVGEGVQAGQTIGWLDEIETPALLGSLIFPPAKRKLKSSGPKRKPQAAMAPMTRVILLAVMMAIVVVVFMVVFLVAPVRVGDVQVMATAPFIVVTAERGLPMPTPTMRFDGPGRDWSSTAMMLTETIADFPAGTRVTIGSAMFNGVEWELHVVTENGVGLDVRESQLEYAAP